MSIYNICRTVFVCHRVQYGRLLCVLVLMFNNFWPNNHVRCLFERAVVMRIYHMVERYSVMAIFISDRQTCRRLNNSLQQISTVTGDAFACTRARLCARTHIASLCYTNCYARCIRVFGRGRAHERVSKRVPQFCASALLAI